MTEKMKSFEESLMPWMQKLAFIVLSFLIYKASDKLSELTAALEAISTNQAVILSTLEHNTKSIEKNTVFREEFYKTYSSPSRRAFAIREDDEDN